MGTKPTGLYGRFAESMAEAGTRRVLVEAGDVALTGSDLATAVERWAAALHARGVRRGDRVAVQVRKSLEQVLLYLANLRLGAVHLPLNESYGMDEIAYFLEDAGPRLFVCDPDKRADHAAFETRFGVTIETLGASGDGSLTQAVAGEHPPAPVPDLADDDLAAIVYTSGTTGRSKGAMLTHRNLEANCRALAEAWAVTDADTLLHALPLFHVHGLFISLNTMLLAGGRTRFLPRFDAAAVLAELPRASLFMGVPTYYTRLLAHGGLDHAKTRHMRLFVCGSAPLLAETFHAFERRTGHRVLERYGMSECGVICSNPLVGERRPGWVGPPLPGVSLRVVDENGAPSADDEVGGIEVAGASLFAGYWKMPEKTRAEFRDGFFVTGDLGVRDADGYVRIVGRSKDLIISGGLNVYPKEIEEILDDLADVGESAVIGLPHPDFGEAVAAVVTPADPARPPRPDGVVEAVRGRLAAFKIPKAVFIADELPRNAMGKVQKVRLRERHARHFAS
jgi:malonyl-CoA/methylmalonyl-CoA synthetase